MLVIDLILKDFAMNVSFKHYFTVKLHTSHHNTEEKITTYNEYELYEHGHIRITVFVVEILATRGINPNITTNPRSY